MRRLAIPLLLALALLLPATNVGAAAAEGVATTWKDRLVIDSATSGTSKMFEAFDTASLNLFDFNGDGQLEIVSNNDNNHVYVFDSRTGKVLTELTTTHPGGEKWPIRELNPIAIGPLYGDGVPCMVVPNSAAYMSAWCYNAGLSTATSFNFTKMWEIKVDAAKYEPDFKTTHPWLFYPENGTLKKEYSLGLDGNAYLSDVNGDGKMEIFVETDGYPGQFAFNHDGTYLWSKSYWDGNGGAKVVDIDKDGVKEAVFVSDAGVVSSYNAKTGGIEWVFESSKNGATPGSIPVPPLVVDLHGDGRYETIFGTRNVYMDQTNPDWINLSHARYFALDSKGQLLWNVSYEWMNPLQYNHPAAADVNKDGVLDVVFLDWNTIGHKPGNWNVTNRDSNLFALDGRDGSLLWRTEIPVYWSNKDFVIADADGDGSQDIIAPTPRWDVDGLGIYDLYTGKKKGWYPSAWQLSRGPVAGNLYGDGKLYLVLPISKKITDRPNYRSLDVGYREGKLVIIETGQSYNAMFSANFQLSDTQKDQQVQGTVGTPPTPAASPTPPTAPTAPPSPATPTPTSPTPANATPTPTSATPTSATPTPAPTPSPTPTPSVAPTPSPTPIATPSPTPTGPTPSPTESVSVPGPTVALVALAAGAAGLLARKRRS